MKDFEANKRFKYFVRQVLGGMRGNAIDVHRCKRTVSREGSSSRDTDSPWYAALKVKPKSAKQQAAALTT